jgi:hypothetical protein
MSNESVSIRWKIIYVLMYRQTLFARKSISTFFLNEISRTIYCAEKTNDIFFQICSKKTFEAKSRWFVCWSFWTRKNVKFVEKKIFLKQHEQRCQEIREFVFDLSSSQIRETQISWIFASFFNFRKFKTKLNNEFHHWFVIFETSKNRVRFDFNDNRSLYQIQFIHFIKENLKCWKLNERINRWNIYQI